MEYRISELINRKISYRSGDYSVANSNISPNFWMIKTDSENYMHLNASIQYVLEAFEPNAGSMQIFEKLKGKNDVLPNENNPK